MPRDLWFTPHMLLNETHRRGFDLGLVIDLTYTKRYYDRKVRLTSLVFISVDVTRVACVCL